MITHVIKRCNMATSPPHKGIWERSAMWKRSDGLRTFMADVKRGDAGFRFHPIQLASKDTQN
jgi:hypothetical protein